MITYIITNKFKLAVIGLITVNTFLLLYFIFGYGTIKIDMPPNSTVYLNENAKGNKNSLVVRPGVYTIRIANKDVSAQTYTIRVMPFSTKTVIATKNDPISIFKEAVNTPYIGGEYNIVKAIPVNNDWLVAKYEQARNGNVTIVAARYIFNKWYIVASYPNDFSTDSIKDQLNKLPDDVQIVYNDTRRIEDED